MKTPRLLYSGVVALAVGSILFGFMVGKPLPDWAVAIVVTMLAAAAAMTVVMLYMIGMGNFDD